METDENVRFDDRLATLLTLPVAGAHDRAVRWRQLVELAARAGREDESGAPFVAALAVIRADSPRIAREVRVAAARAIAGRTLALPLLELFAQDELAVAAPLLAGHRLGKAQLLRLLEIADPDVRAFLLTLHPSAAGEGEGGLSDIVARLQASRDVEDDIGDRGPGADDGPAEFQDERADEGMEPLGEPLPVELAAPAVTPEPTSGPEPAFRFECNASGEIDWVDGIARGALIGLSLAAAEEAGPISVAFARREPIWAMPLAIEPLGAEYVVTAAPAFDPGTGRFLGYRGEGREVPSDADTHDLPKPPSSGEAARPAATTRNVESLRELVHEIKTPLNAIIGFAEIIDGQFLGPAHRGYRERAAEIVAQARILLGAIEDLDFAAREQAQRTADDRSDAPDADVRVVAQKVAQQVKALADRKGVRLVVDLPDDDHHCRLDAGLAERLLRRLFGSLLETLDEGETLFVEGERKGSHCVLKLARPSALKGLSEQRLLDPSLSLSAEGGKSALLGLGFSLRLVRGLVRIAGGELSIEPDRVLLHLPVATP